MLYRRVWTIHYQGKARELYFEDDRVNRTLRINYRLNAAVPTISFQRELGKLLSYICSTLIVCLFFYLSIYSEPESEA